MAVELQANSDLLSKALDAIDNPSRQLPMEDHRIGTYVYDAAERSKPINVVFSRLEANYTVSYCTAILM
jgi:hypothetical protein